MAGSVSLIPFGFSLIDTKWGGVYKGGSYLLLGSRKSGRTLLGLQFALEAAKAREVCLYFTNMRPKDVMIQAASLNFDIQSYMNQNLIIVVRVAPPNDVYDMNSPDYALVEYLNDIITVVSQYKPSRIIFDELTPYIGFRNVELLRETFLRTLETVEDQDITSLFLVSEPATDKAQAIIDVLAQSVTGIIYLKKDTSKGQLSQGGKVIISPNIGHTEGQFCADYKIEPYKGLIIDEPEEKKPVQQTQPQSNMRTTIQIPKNETNSDSMGFSNLYNQNDFQLILNNQIALFKSTGQTFNLVSFKLDPAAQVKGLLSINQLQNAVRMSTDKKDKICAVDNKIIVLIARSNPQSVPNLLSQIQSHFPSVDENYLSTVLEYISIMNIEIDENISNAENMMGYIVSSEADSEENYVPLNKFTG